MPDHVPTPWDTYLAPTSLDEALDLLGLYADGARIIAGGTDLLLELQRGVRTQRTLIDITRLPDLDQVTLDEHGQLHLGPLVTHNQVVASPLLRARAWPLVRACWEVGAPQIRNRGTVAGNLVTASPANDTITPLMALDAGVTLASHRGRRTLPLSDFMLGVRRTALAADELLLDISFPAMAPDARGTFVKFGLRRAQAISLVNLAIVLRWDGTTARAVRLALGAVAPTIICATDAEQALEGSDLDDATLEAAAHLAAQAATPIDDVRGRAAYRRSLVAVLVRRAMRQLRDHAPHEDSLDHAITLGPSAWPAPTRTSHIYDTASPLTFTLNGQSVTVHDAAGRTLLEVLRGPTASGGVGLTGTKEGCAEGECGACTVLLNGAAVMSCLVPAAAAAGCEVITVEGLAAYGHAADLHTVQRAFVEAGAVQCGYCTPGLLVSAARLLAETPHPDRAAVEAALAGNLCRCTGYARIVDAVVHAGAAHAAGGWK
jgi:carbon-monoxide dehydrogenase medium subunit